MHSSTSIQGSGLVISVGSCAQIASVHLGDASVATNAGPLSRTPPGRRDISSTPIQHTAPGVYARAPCAAFSIKVAIFLTRMVGESMRMRRFEYPACNNNFL